MQERTRRQAALGRRRGGGPCQVLQRMRRELGRRWRHSDRRSELHHRRSLWPCRPRAAGTPTKSPDARALLPTRAHACPPIPPVPPGDDGQLGRAMRRCPNLAVWRQPSEVSLARALYHRLRRAESSHKLCMSPRVCTVQTATGRQLLVQGAAGEPPECCYQEQAWRRGRGRRYLQCKGVWHQAAQERTQGGVGQAHASRRGFTIHPSATAHARYGYEAATNLSNLSERAGTALHRGRCQRPRVAVCARGGASVPVTSRRPPVTACSHTRPSLT